MIKELRLGKIIYGMMCFIAIMLCTGKCTYAASSYTYKNYGSTDFLSYDKFVQLCNVLASSTGDDMNQDTTPLHSTGITFGSYEEAVAAAKSFQYLFMGENEYGVAIEREGASGYIYGVTKTDSGVQYTVRCSSGYGAYTLLMGWLPGSDPNKCVSEHNAAMDVIMNVVASAPEDSCQAYRYFNDWLCNSVNYDYSYSPSSYSGYGALCTGASVCAGYAKAFMGLCYNAGKYCITVSGTKGGGNHSWNAVWDGNSYKWVDVTWADQNGWINYGEFMTGVEENWVNYFNESFCIIS